MLQNGKTGPKKSAPECPFECGGVQSLFGKCPNRRTNFWNGASLTDGLTWVGARDTCVSKNVWSKLGFCPNRLWENGKLYLKVIIALDLKSSLMYCLSAG